MDVQTRIRDVLSTSLLEESQEGHASDFGERELLQVLRDQGIIEEVMGRLQFDGAIGSTPKPRMAPQGPKPAIHFPDKQDKVMGVPLKKGQLTMAEIFLDPPKSPLYSVAPKTFIE